MSQNNPQISYEQAKKQIIKTRNFYLNLTIYTFVNLLLLAIDVLPDRSWDWSFWVIFGWGIGIVFEAASLYIPNPNFYKNWEEKKIQDLMKKN